MAKTLLFGGVLGQFHPCEHEQQALWLGLATGGVQEIPEIGEAHAACVMVIGAKLARTTSEGGRAHVAPRVRLARSGAGSIGRGSGRGRVCREGLIWVGA